jgi:hypothetical protein
VENFVMLGSAGIDVSVPSADRLRVPPDRVWASEAVKDWVADVGRLGSGRIDPTSAEYGANVFSSESAFVGGEHLPGSDGHKSAPLIEYEITGEPPAPFVGTIGYLDAGTHPLHNVGMLSLGLTVDGNSNGGGGR